MTTATFTVFFALLIYQVHLANIGEPAETVKESPKSLLDDMQLTRNKIEHSDPTHQVETGTGEEDFEFSGDDSVGGDDADVEYSGEIELMAYDDYDEPAKKVTIATSTSWEGEGVVGVAVSTVGSDLNFTVSTYVNKDLIEMLKNLRTKCVLYQNANTSNFIIYC